MIRQGGFTLLEIMITLAIFSATITLGLFVGLDFYKSYILTTERDTLISILRKARADAMNNFLESPRGIFIGNNEYIIFSGYSYLSRNSDYDESIVRSRAIFVSGLQEIIFQPVSGISETFGETNLSDGIKNAVIEINEEGRISW